MLLLALMTIGMLPLFLRAAQTSTSNRSLVAATAFANSQLAEVRAAFGNDSPRSCSELVDPAKSYLRTGFPDPAGTGLAADRLTTAHESRTPSPSQCPAFACQFVCTAGAPGLSTRS